MNVSIHDNVILNSDYVGTQVKIQSSNVSWTTHLYFSFNVTNTIPAGSLINISAVYTFENKNKEVLLASYETHSITSFVVTPKGTSLSQTPSYNLTLHEAVYFGVTIAIPSVTTQLSLTVTLPAFGHTTPIEFLQSAVKLDNGITSERMRSGSSSKFFSKGSTPNSNVVRFEFGNTSSVVPYMSSGSSAKINFDIVGMVKYNTQYNPGTISNVTFEMEYSTLDGIHHSGPINKVLTLSQPPLLYFLDIVDSQDYYQGYDSIMLSFKISNPQFATASARDVFASIQAPIGIIKITNYTLHICDIAHCTPFLKDNSSSLNMTLSSSLNPGSRIEGSFNASLQPSVTIGSEFKITLLLSYNRPSWVIPVVEKTSRTIKIKNAHFSGPHKFSSSLLSPNDSTVIVPGEDLTYQLLMTLPVGTSNTLSVVVRGEGVMVVQGSIVTAGKGIHSESGNLQGKALNVTNNAGFPVGKGVFTKLTNNDTTQTPTHGQVTFEIACRALNMSLLTGKDSAKIVTEIQINGQPVQQKFEINLKILKPQLHLTTTVTPTSKVNRQQDVHYTASLAHKASSTSHAYQVLLELALPHDYLVDPKSIEPQGKMTRVVTGDKAPSASNRYNNPLTKVIVYETGELPLHSNMTLRFTATSTSTLPFSLLIAIPVHLRYAVLPSNLKPENGGLYSLELNSAPFLTFRPSPYVQVLYTSSPKEVDAGDHVVFNATVVNTRVGSESYTAYELMFTFEFKSLDMNHVTLHCTQGTTTIHPANATANVDVGDFVHGKQFYCNITGRVKPAVAPGEDVSPVIRYGYFSTPSSRPAGSAPYNQIAHARTLVAGIKTNITASHNALNLLAGQDVSFKFRILVFECTTRLVVLVQLPVVSLTGTRFERQRRSLDGRVNMESLERFRGRRSVSNIVQVLIPVYNLSTITTDPTSTLVISNTNPTITLVNGTVLEIDFGLVQNPPTLLRSYQGISILLQFKIAPLPLVLSGRSLVLGGIVRFTGGESPVNYWLRIVGPLIKPLLTISKSVKVVDKERDSPVFQYSVTVTHLPGSPADAYDVIVIDDTKNVDVDRLSVVPKSDVVVTYPQANVYRLTYSIPKLKVGQTAIMSYKASFIIKAKDEKTIDLPARVTWKSIQINSFTYNLVGNLTSCVKRLDVSKYKTKQITGYFALGILLGLLIGFIVAIVVIILIIKCCDKGKIAPCYSRFTCKDSVTVLTGGSQYIFTGEDGARESKFISRHNEASMVKTEESIIPILSLDKATQTEKELDSLDLQATVKLDAELEVQRQNMFVHILSLLVMKMRVKRDISSSQEKKFLSRLKAELGGVTYKMSAEFKRKSAEITTLFQKETKKRMKEQAKRQAREREEANKTIAGLVDARERNEILNVLQKRHAKEDRELKKKAKLDLDVEMEKLRKEATIGKRFAMKDSQSKLLRDLIKEARFNEEQANALVREHFSNMAAIDKIMDEERSRRIVALEMRLAERRALGHQKHEDARHNQVVMDGIAEHQDQSLADLISSGALSEADANSYREKYRKEVEALSRKLEKERQKQENTLHKKLTVMKQKRAEDLNRQHQEELRKLSEEENDKLEQIEIDCVASLQERQKVIERQKREIEDLEKQTDNEAAKEIEILQDRQARELQEQAKTSISKICHDMTSKGLSESIKNAIIDKHVSELSRQQEAKEEQRQRNAQLIEKRLSKLRKALERKANEEMKEQEEVRKNEQQIVSDLILSQFVMSDEERDRILEEHEKNLVELESSLTLNKLRQRQKLEERLAEKRKRRMEQLERKQQQEEQFRDYADKILNEAEDIKMLKKHELEKAEILRDENENQLDDDMEHIREEMMKERATKLHEHQENLSATIAKLQIQKAKQISQMSVQQQILNQLQTNLVDELESKGAFEDPATKEIVAKYKKDAKKVEDNLRNQRQKQEEDLRKRLQQKLEQREKSMQLENKTKYSKYVDGGESNKPVLRFRKAAIKARHEEQLNNMRKRMEIEIEQSLNELRLNLDLKRMKAIEERNIKFIAALVSKGKLKEEELESVLKFLFPSKSPEYIDSLLTRIYGNDHNKTTSSTGEIGELETRIRQTSIRPIQLLQNAKIKTKEKKLKQYDEHLGQLPPVIVRGRDRPRGDSQSDRLHSPVDSPESSGGTSPLQPRSSPSFSPVNSGENQRLLDEMFAGSSEPETVGPEKKRSKKRRDR